MPLAEWMIAYFYLRMGSKAKLTIWIQPIILGLLGFLQDFWLDPMAVRLVTNGINWWT
ncbi:MAG: hypothetical protein ACYDH1_12120 [Anaerolineaceae bacterium]